MAAQLLATDLHPILAGADRAAAQLCRGSQSHLIEREDVRQELLLDVLTRLGAYDPSRSSLPKFANVCAQHRAAQLRAKLWADHRARHPASLDGLVRGEVTLADSLTGADSYAAWMGQPTDGFDEVERRLDLDRALSGLSMAALTICAILITSDMAPAAAAGLSRTTLHRRIQDLRCRLLAAGIGAAVEQTAHPVGI